MDTGNISSETRDTIDDTSTSNEEETSHELAIMNGRGKGNHFPWLLAHTAGSTDTR